MFIQGASFQEKFPSQREEEGDHSFKKKIEVALTSLLELGNIFSVLPGTVQAPEEEASVGRLPLFVEKVDRVTDRGFLLSLAATVSYVVIAIFFLDDLLNQPFLAGI